MGVRGFRHSIASYVPWWLSNRPLLNAGFKYLYTAALMLDVMIEVAIQGVHASQPGRGDPSTLPYIGRSRGLVQGEAESNTSFIERLEAWLDTWSNAGADEIICQLIQGYLGNTPSVKFVDRAGHWTMLDSSGNFTYANGVSLNWDSVSDPGRSGYWSDVWLIVYPTEWAVTAQATFTAVAAAYGTFGAWAATGLGLGHQVNKTSVDAIRQLVAQWRGAHTNLRAIIWSYDGTLFDPTTPGSLPDGTWGDWAYWDGSSSLPHRSTSCRYWVPPDSLPN